MRVWYNHGYSQTRDAFVLLRNAIQPPLHLIATSGALKAPLAAQADHFALEPSTDRTTEAGQLAYVDWCLAFAAQHHVDVFVPQRARSAIARRHAEFEALGITLVLTATADTLDLIENKTSFYTACAAAGLPTPAFHEVHSLAGFDAAVAHIHSLGHQACIKPPQGVFGAGYWRLDDATPLFSQLMNPDHRRLRTEVVREAIREMESIHAPDAMPRLLVMQHLPGSEWSIDCVCASGRIIAGVSRQKIGTTQLLEAHPEAMALAARLAKLFNLSNLVNIQVKAASPDNTGPHVLEINPRMSGGCVYASLAGLNLPAIQLQHATGTLGAVPQPRRTTVAAITQAIEVTPEVTTSEATSCAA